MMRAAQPSLSMEIPRFYPILDTEILEQCGCPLIQAAEAVLEAGGKIVQIRHKGHYSRPVFDDVERISLLCRSAGTKLILNDRADIAALVDAGLHLGQDDLEPTRARKILGPARPLGFSTHNEAQLLASLAEPADYLALGPIFNTGSKRNPDPAVGVDELSRLRRLAGRPLVAIGGITRANAPAVFAAGAESVAVIGDLLSAPASREAIRARAEEWLRL